MYRCEDCGLVDNDEGLTVDPDWLDDTLRILTVWNKNGTDAVWQFAAGSDPNDLLKLRMKQKVYLARYLRQPLDYWDSVEVIELMDYVDETSALMARENPTTGMTEDR